MNTKQNNGLIDSVNGALRGLKDEIIETMMFLETLKIEEETRKKKESEYKPHISDEEIQKLLDDAEGE
jgi:hypothetical protein